MIVHLIIHGAIILLIGQLCGIPMGKAINHEASEQTVRAWRVAHSGLCMGAILLLALASVLEHVVLSPSLSSFMGICFIVSGYGFALALPLGARTGQRGLRPSTGVGAVVYFGNMVGAQGALVGTGILLYGALRTAF